MGFCIRHAIGRDCAVYTSADVRAMSGTRHRAKLFDIVTTGCYMHRVDIVRIAMKSRSQNYFPPVMTLLLVLAGLMVPAGQPLLAQSIADMSSDQATAPITVRSDAGAVTISWDTGGVAAAAALDRLPTVRYGGHDLPMRLVPVLSDDDSMPNIEELSAVDWIGDPPRAEALTPTAIDFENDRFMLTPSEPETLPQSPVFLFSKGRSRGREVRVVAVSPIYEDDDGVKFVTKLQARIDNSEAIDSPSDALTMDTIQGSSASPRIGATGDLGPTNSAAAQGSIRITASERGMQRITGAMLQTAGFDAGDVTQLYLTHKGQAIPIEIADSNGDGKLEGAEFFDFYAPGVGDYWNAYAIFWLSKQAGGLRIESRNVKPRNASLRTTAVEQGTWKKNSKYISQHAGPDDDHWYAADMKVDPSMQDDPASFPKIVATLEPQLPLASGSQAIFTANLNTYIKGLYEVTLKVGGSTETVELDTRNDAASARIWQPEISFDGPALVVEATLNPTSTIAGLLFDSLDWTLPVSLQLGGSGALFTGVAGVWRYQFTGATADYAVYDVTDWSVPQRLTGIENSIFEDGPDAGDYLVTGPGALHTPDLQAHTRVSFSPSDGADALYIAPAGFIDALKPLVEHRESQGYRVKVIDVQQIYDAWSYGYVEPDAIRDFLRFAVANWNPAPISAVLVSDGTRDPFNYEDRDSFVNYIPPYLRTSFLDQNGFERFVDPWLGQNGCDNCYAQLDGDDPLNNAYETPGKGFLIDIWLGRFPVKTAQEVSNVVSKIIRYETNQEAPAYWSHTAAFLADDYVRPDGSADSAGNFIAYSEAVVGMLAAGIRAARVYYDPHYAGNEPWRESDAAMVRARAIELAGSGPGLLTFNGHANHWQWAGTALTSEHPYIFGLYDVDLLKNRNQLFVSLSMTCYTSQFFQPSNSGTTLDERMFLHPGGGAAAVWGPSGLSVLHGHDDLQYGFHKLLWNSEPGSMRLGALMDAGYYENFSPSAERDKLYSCCEDVRRTFLLFGDPLMKVRMEPSNNVYLPLVTKR